ncbi:MAG: cytochrome C [Polaromonas sp. 39-63-203]|jgi:mono/diheme cytochrome c family protein|uniref:diheme cytochrome c n=1 Tax=Polaromonas sp. TaxID=1869339 RepID=UPI000BC87EBC|nr:diheme cytochrome c [Polaromonas sp.]OYY52714.1 MAG: cytochrome C [Polaromonas sp. 35-63-240]OYY96459.1 MAG: cytochrome C [Polaromonas sp. 28-63-22]OYZ84373.1 MAG: cytochrome C [Polaromonas sp. 24-62-144]OZA98634.1 MAG: cytochrome C [Polaromonas sp. 39-63-203]HQS32486.1 diheme cytochrome c [Polaromonas sp.]
MMRFSLARFFSGCTLLAASVAAANADSGGNSVPLNQKYKQECAACHTPYPPGMLPAASWKRIMGSLEKHYGTDASVDEATLRDLGVWLGANAGTYKRVQEDPPEDRITRSAWFLREHNAREVPPDTWKRASVGSPSNCVACHTQAAQGSFRERDIRIPK